MKNNIVDLGAFLSAVVVGTEEEGYQWRLHSVNSMSTEINQLVLAATLDKRDNYSVVEVGIRKIYKDKGVNFDPDKLFLSLAGNNKSGNEIYKEVGLSVAIIHVVEIASLTLYRDKELTPIHHMILDATKVRIKFNSPWEGDWPKKISWAKTAYNYDDLLCDRQKFITEDQQRRIEGLVLAMIKNKPSSEFWLCQSKHQELSGMTGWEAVQKQGFAAVEKHICWIDRHDSDWDSGA
jgi:hypothetical protein